MLKRIATIFLGLASVVYALYIYRLNQPNLSARLISWVLLPRANFNDDQILLIYVLISNKSIKDNSVFSQTINIKIKNQTTRVNQYYGLEDIDHPNYYIIPKPNQQVMLIPEIKTRLLHTYQNPIPQGQAIHGYIPFTISPSIDINSIEEVQITIQDVFLNSFTATEKFHRNLDILTFLQLSNAKIYNQGEEQYLNEAIQKYK